MSFLSLGAGLKCSSRDFLQESESIFKKEGQE